MFWQPGESRRKRSRENEDDLDSPNLQQHRPKRHIASLPLRGSPEQKRRLLPSFQPPQAAALADITPAGSDSEDILPACEPRSFLPWPSPPDQSLESSQPSSEPYQSSSQSQMQESIAYSDDLEMTDSGLLHPGPFHSDPSTSIASRIPTPIHSQFASYIRSTDKVPSFPDQNIHILSDNYNYNNTSSTPNPPRQGHRLPSPISEDEAPSPSFLLQGLSDVQMEVIEEARILPAEDEKPTPKKGHSRSKHSLRNWGGFGPGPELAGGGVKKGFSMGYRADCEKCRLRVPGHFSHVVTY